MKRGARRLSLMAAVLLLSGCAGNSTAVVGALLNTGIAMGASGASRAKGGCYAACPAGTTCNRKTGACDPLPCRGECDPFEECVEGWLTSSCQAPSLDTGKIIVNPSSDTPKPAPKSEKPAEPAP